MLNSRDSGNLDESVGYGGSGESGEFDGSGEADESGNSGEFGGSGGSDRPGIWGRVKKLPEQQDLSRKNYPEKARKPLHFFEFTPNVPKIFGCQTFCEIETA